MMKRIAQGISWLALAGILASACMFYGRRLDQVEVNGWLLGFTVVWFVATPIWMEHQVGE